MVHRGYGVVHFGKRVQAHRLAWALHNGEDPGSRVVRHSCDNKLCVNPAHLEIGSQGDNMKDRSDRGRTAWGNGHPMRKLAMADVGKIRLLLSEGVTGVDIARMFNVSPSTICLINTRKTWNPR